MPLKRWLFCLLAPVLLSLTDDPVYLDVYSRETEQDIVFGNAHLELHVDKGSGEWTSWTHKPAAPSLITPDTTRPALDFSINGDYLLAKHGATFLRSDRAIDKDRRGRLTLTDIQTGKPVVLTPVGANTFAVTLQPSQGVMGRIIK